MSVIKVFALLCIVSACAGDDAMEAACKNVVGQTKGAKEDFVMMVESRCYIFRQLEKDWDQALEACRNISFEGNTRNVTAQLAWLPTRKLVNAVMEFLDDIKAQNPSFGTLIPWVALRQADDPTFANEPDKDWTWRHADGSEGDPVPGDDEVWHIYSLKVWSKKIEMDCAFLLTDGLMDNPCSIKKSSADSGKSPYIHAISLTVAVVIIILSVSWLGRRFLSMKKNKANVVVSSQPVKSEISDPLETTTQN